MTKPKRTPEQIEQLIERQQLRLSLYHAGLNDAEIGEDLGVTKEVVFMWRKVSGLPANNAGCPAVTADQHAARMRLYKSGLTDKAIGKEVGAAQTTIVSWRKKHGLPATERRFDLTPEREAARLLLYQLRYSDRRIARDQRCSWTGVQSWRKRRGLPPHGLSRANWNRKGMSRDTVLERIKRAIGRALPPDIVSDAVQDLYVALLTGEVCLDAIEREARRYGNRVLAQFASKFGPRSLDEELSDDGDGFRMIDLVRDDRSSSWLEDMGATVW